MTKLDDYEVIWNEEAVTSDDIKKAINNENNTRKKMRYLKISCFALSLLFACFYKISPLESAISYIMLSIACISFIVWAVLFCGYKMEPISNSERILGFFQEKHLDLLNHLNNCKLIGIESKITSENNDEIFLFHFTDKNGKEIVDIFRAGLFGNVCKKYENNKLIRVFDFSSYNWSKIIQQTITNYSSY